MKLDDIFALWEQDSKVNKAELGDAALNISQLHNKYYRIFVNERLVLRKYEAELKQLRLAKHEFFLLGPTEETRDAGWELPAVGRPLKSDIPTYIEADKDIVALSLKIGMQSEKVELLSSIIKTIAQRSFNVKAAIEWERFKVGA